ncbi:MAG TPA: hypothetical protein VEV84_05695 [Pyrinomonadaceae bacterium]|nr:hypothetical protein [Pyrinomonadaceae bacterium]
MKFHRGQKSYLYTILAFVFLSISIPAQGPVLTGKYEGTAEVHGTGKLPISAEIREQGGKITGVVHTPLGDTSIIDGTYAAGAISITLDAGGDDIFLKGKVAVGGTISGQVTGETVNGTFDLKRTDDLPAKVEVRAAVSQSKEKWREDLQYLATELPKRHKNAFNLISKQQWDQMVAELDARIPSLSDEQIILGMAHIVTRIGDGHTGLGWGWLFPRLPLEFFWFGKELRVTSVTRDHPQLVGARITRIEGVDVDKLYEHSRDYIATNESEQYVLNNSAYLLTRPVFLKVFGAGASDDSATLQFIDARGRKSTVTVKAVPDDVKVEWLEAYKTAPLYLQNKDAAFYYEYLKDAKAVYVNFKWYPRRPEFKKFSKELFDFIDTHDVDKLVFDFRLNGGGDFTRGRDFFVKPIKERKKFLEHGHLFAITGRRTFSAGMANVADFRNDLHAILVGEPTGARPNGYQENRGFDLPNSHLPVSYSIELYHFSDNDTPGIIPDKLIVPDWRSYVAGRDPVLEWILAYPKNK